MAELHQIFILVVYGHVVLLWRLCDTLSTSGFLDDVMFSWHRANGQNQAWRYVQKKLARWRNQLDVSGTRGVVCYLRLTYFSVLERWLLQRGETEVCSLVSSSSGGAQSVVTTVSICRFVLMTIIIITKTIFMVLSSWLRAIARVHPAHLTTADWAPCGHQTSNQANRLGLWVCQ